MDNEKNNFGSWRDKLNENQGEQQQKSIDGVEKGFVSKEGFVIKNERRQRAEKARNQASSPKTESSLQSPTPVPKKGFSRWLKILLLIILIIIIAGALYIFIFYKSNLEISVAPPDARIKVNGKVLSSTNIKLRPGSHDLEIEKEGYVTYGKKGIQINYFKTTQISVVLKEIPSLVSITDLEAQFPAYNKEQGLYLFFVPKEFAFYRLEAEKIKDNEKNPTLTTPHYIKNLRDVVWNPDRLTAILKIENNNQALTGTPFYSPAIAQGVVMTFMYDFGRYDLLHQEANFWDTGIGDIKFTPDGNQVAYYYEPGSGEKSLIIANKDHSNINRILDMRSFTNPKISWANDLKNIVIVNQSKDYKTNLIYNFNVIKKQLTPITDTGNNIDAVFSPENNLVLYSTYSSDPDFSTYSLLSVMKPDGKDKKELGVRSLFKQTAFTAPEKIVFFEEKIAKDFKLFGQDLNSLERTNYLFLGEALENPTIEEFIASTNSIVISQEFNIYSLVLTSDSYQ